MSRKMTVIGDAVHGVVAADEFVWRGVGWQRGARVTYTPSENLKDTQSKVLASGWGFGAADENINGFMGFVLDPAITRVRVRDHLDGVYEAKLFQDAEGGRIWFCPKIGANLLNGIEYN
ncbi:hypothetical protein [Thermobacillus composti]|uniref:hypothetical protein n=1 Tax=Thermobacillus composti TaxID=377615 RepID=UPI00031D60D7|nr:hypothetical protein [Thermobacillus composti]